MYAIVSRFNFGTRSNAFVQPKINLLNKMADIQSATTSSADSTKRSQQPKAAEVNIPLWDRVLRIIFGKIRNLPKNMNTILILFTVQVQMTVPFFLLANVTFNVRSLLRPFRILHSMGFDFDELYDKYRPLI